MFWKTKNTLNRNNQCKSYALIYNKCSKWRILYATREISGCFKHIGDMLHTLFCRSLFVILFFFVLAIVFFFYLLILITPLVSSIYGFWLPLWYLRFTDSDYPFGIFYLRILITPLVSSSSSCMLNIHRTTMTSLIKIKSPSFTQFHTNALISDKNTLILWI